MLITFTAREWAISGGSSSPPKPPEDPFQALWSLGCALLPTTATKDYNRTRIPTTILPLLPRRSTGYPFALGLIVDGTISTKQGRLVSVRDQPPSPPCFNTPPTTLAAKTTGEPSDNNPSKPTFTRLLIEHKLHTLKMRYKRITQRRAKLMRAIRNE